MRWTPGLSAGCTRRTTRTSASSTSSAPSTSASSALSWPSSCGSSSRCPLNNFLGAAAFDQAVTLHGLIMILWFLSPLAIAFMNYMMPLQIGAEGHGHAEAERPRLLALRLRRDHSRRSASSSPAATPAEGGRPTPRSRPATRPGPGPTLAFLGLIMLVVSITMGSVNILLTIAYMRAPGHDLAEDTDVHLVRALHDTPDALLVPVPAGGAC